MRKIFAAIGILFAIILSLFLYKWITGISSNKQESASVVSEQEPIVIGQNQVNGDPVRGIHRMEKMAEESNGKIIEFGDYVYLGGSWGLIVGSKNDENFQKYIAQERVQKVELKNNRLQYEELNNTNGNWEFKSINLQAYEDFLNKEATEALEAQTEQQETFITE